MDGQKNISTNFYLKLDYKTPINYVGGKNMSVRFKTVSELINEGYAVVLITPKELRGADPIKVEDRLIAHSVDVIDFLATQEDEE